jgi:pyruvate dehydrogenase E1 component beta subunit
MHNTQRHITVAQAILEATEACMNDDPSVYLMGLGVADPGAIFGTTRGLVEKYGADRVIEMPTAESGLTGIAIGSAMMGRRPVMTHQRVEFSLLAFENIINTAAKMRYTTAGKVNVPIVIRLIIGRGWGQGPCHAQSLESVFGHFPGLKVVMPTTAYDAKGMLVAAIRDDDPTIFIEHRWLHSTLGNVPEETYEVSLTQSRVVQQGTDITLVASSFMVIEAMAVTRALKAAGVSTELIDLRAIRPLDIEPVRQSVNRTGRLLCIDTGWTTFGVGGEIIARIAETGIEAFKAPPRRLGMSDYPSPSTRALIPDYYPYPVNILEQALAILQLPADKADIARSALQETQKDRLADVPDADFSGPF